MPSVPFLETSVVPFEQRLKGDLQGALAEGSLYFEERGSVWQTCRRIAELLEREQVAYAITGALALFHHGYRRFTPNVNLLVAADDFQRARKNKSGFVLSSEFARSLIHEATGVRVQFVRSGETPGGTRGMGVQFPHPREVTEIDEVLRFLTLPAVIDCKLAAGLSNCDRLRDLCDVEQLILVLGLSENYANKLHPAVRHAFREICQRIDSAETRCLRLVPMPPEAAPARSIEELLPLAGSQRPLLDSMRADGVVLNSDRSFYDGFAVLLSTRRLVARKYDMHPESDYLFD